MRYATLVLALALGCSPTVTPSNDAHVNGDGGVISDASPDASPDAPCFCADDQACTVDSCDPVTGECVYTPDDSSCESGSHCDVDLGCTTVERCTTSDQCDDHDACTIDTCGLGDVCGHMPRSDC